MGDTLQIVDSVASSPTVLLDLNNESPYGMFEFAAPTPPLKRSVSSTMLVDGDRIAATSYGNRVLTVGLDLIHSSQDNWASSWQSLARQLDREWFWLKYQPTGLSSPVFFKVYRSEAAIETVAGATAYRRVSLDLPAAPFAVGLAEDISSFTITNDPTTGTNRMMVGPSTLGTVKGDVETPLLLAQTSGPSITSAEVLLGDDVIYCASYSLTGSQTFSFLSRDLAELTSGTDVGSAVTGAGSNFIGGNYKSCSFGTTSMASRLTGAFSTALNPLPGVYRALIRFTIPGSTSTPLSYTFKLGVRTGSSQYTYTDEKTLSTTRTASERSVLLDLGLVQLPTGADYGGVGLGAAPTSGVAPNFDLQASCGGTVQAIRFDQIFFLPVRTNYGVARTSIRTPATFGDFNVICYDGENDQIRTLYDASTTAPFSGVPTSALNLNWQGGLPTVLPGANNYLIWLFEDTTVGDTTSFRARYHPRYLFVRPAST